MPTAAAADTARTVPISARLASADVDALDAAAELHFTTRSRLVAHLVAQGLPALDGQSENRDRTAAA